MLKDHPLNSGGEDGAKFVAEYLATIIHMVRKLIENGTMTAMSMNALSRALFEKDPELAKLYDAYFETDERNRKLSTTMRQIIAELDRLHGRVKYDDKGN